MPGFRKSSTAMEGPPVASEGGSALNQPGSLPKPRLSMTGLRKILLPRPPDALFPSASKRLAAPRSPMTWGGGGR